jgi:mycothiol system anti-sigma-R factor
MSCGKPHDVDCSEVLERVWLYLDGEIEDADVHEIREHLDECAPCLRQYGLDQAVKVLVARSCGGDPAPEGLRSRVVARLQQVQVEITQVEYRAE